MIRIKQYSVETELLCDGEYFAGWAQFDIPEDIIGKLENMMTKSYELGQSHAKAEIRKILGLHS